MRIIAGKYRSRRLQLPTEKYTRPTGSRVRESLFSMLVSRMSFSGTRVLDAFAGSGALGLEALSRGAAHVTFVEQNRSVYQVLQHNVKSIASPDEYKLILSDLLKVKLAEPFGLIFLDPPYHNNLYDSSLQSIVDQNWLSPNGIIAVETPNNVELNLPLGVDMVIERAYGKSKLILLIAK